MDILNIESRLVELEALEKSILGIAKKLMAPGEVEVFPLDLLSTAVMDRSLSIIFGFTSMIRKNNFVCAAPLVRLHLDSLLRFYACWICEDPHKLASDVLNGVHVSNLKDIKGKKMTDSYLVKELAVDFPWIKSVYEESSGWVHLSKKHILNSTSIADSDNRLMSHKISRIDYVSDTLKIEAIECMKEITSLILEFLEGWNHTKRYPPNSIISEL